MFFSISLLLSSLYVIFLKEFKFITIYYRFKAFLYPRTIKKKKKKDVPVLLFTYISAIDNVPTLKYLYTHYYMNTCVYHYIHSIFYSLKYFFYNCRCVLKGDGKQKKTFVLFILTVGAHLHGQRSLITLKKKMRKKFTEKISLARVYINIEMFKSP